MRIWTLLFIIVSVFLGTIASADQQAVTQDGYAVLLKADGTWSFAGDFMPCWAITQRQYKIISVSQTPIDKVGEKRLHDWTLTITNETTEELSLMASVLWLDSNWCTLDRVTQGNLLLSPLDTITVRGGNIIDSSLVPLIDSVVARIEVLNAD